MSNKFKYAPGLPGFGSKGNDGSAGNQGLAMYFTDLDPVTATSSIESRIRNNVSLWSVGSVALPDGRTYVTGDIFFDSEGKAYEINAETGTYSYKFASLNMGGYFVPLGVTSDDGYLRYFNSNTSPKYIIDNVFSSGEGIDYSQVPTNIYSIDPQNFARIEYSEVVAGNYNPFTLYASGVTAGADDHKAIAIVREISSNTFRLGNLDNTGSLRNVNLIFDVSSLKQTKEAGNSFSANTADGTVLTNHEIDANVLFDDNFNSLPDSFVGVYGASNDCSIKWKLEDFINDTNTDGLIGTLYFYTNKNPYNGDTFGFDSSAMRPLIFNNVDVSGAIRITGLKLGDNYSFFMKLSKNGWTRNSTPQSVFGGSMTVLPLSQNVSWGSDAAWDSSAAFAITSNVPWSYSYFLNPSDMFTTTVICTSLGGSPSWDGSLFIDISSNEFINRTGTVRFQPAGATAINANVNQYGPIALATASISSGTATQSGGNYNDEYVYVKRVDTLNMVNLPAGTYVDVCLNTVFNIYNSTNTAGGSVYYKYYVALRNSSGSILGVKQGDRTWGPLSFNNSDTSAGYIYVADVSAADFPLTIDVSIRIENYDYPPTEANVYVSGDLNWNITKIAYASGPYAVIDNNTAGWYAISGQMDFYWPGGI